LIWGEALEFSDKLKGESGKDYAYRILKDNIMMLNLKPGQSISETELSKQLDISRTPIREVLMKLKEEHLIEVKPQIGTYIAFMDLHLVEEAFFMRFVLEKEVLKLACIDFPEEKILELDKNFFAQKHIFGSNGKEIEFHRLDILFHETIFSGVKMEEVWNGILKLSAHYNRLRLMSEIRYSNKDSINQHEKYINIIKNKDLAGVEQLVTEHIQKPRKNWEKLFNEDPEFKNYFK
jgi:GntR family transcriptional regulator, rspAB operon transcriptional repressor